MTFGYNGKPWTFSNSPKDRFDFDVPPPQQYATFKEELQLTARKFADMYHGETIHIMHGGGMDSEAIIWGFRRARVPFKPVCVVDTGGANRREVADVVSAEFYPINAKAWLLSAECRSLAKESQISYCSMMFLTHTLLNHMRGKVVIVGFTEPEIEQGALTESEWFYGMWKFFFNHGVLGTPIYWSVFPQLYYSYLQGLVNYGESKQRLYNGELGLRIRSKIDWHNNIQFWGPLGMWRRRVITPLGQALARIDLGLA